MKNGDLLSLNVKQKTKKKGGFGIGPSSVVDDNKKLMRQLVRTKIKKKGMFVD